MANKKFSEFVLKTSTSDVSHIVGYNGAENVQITPANFVTTGGTGVFLPLAGGTMVGNTIHNDNVKSIYGSPGNELSIYNNGTNQDRIESLSSFLVIEASNLIIRNNGGTEDYAKFQGNLGVELYYDGSKKLETTSSGISVTGGGVFTGNVNIESTNPILILQDTDATATFNKTEIQNSGGSLLFNTRQSNGTFVSTDYLQSKNSTGAITHQWFTSGTEKMRLDSSGNLGVGTSTPTDLLSITSTSNSNGFRLIYPNTNSGAYPFYVGNSDGTNYVRANSRFIAFKNNGGISGIKTEGSSNDLSLETTGNLLFNVGASERMRLTSGGKLGINEDSPSAKLVVNQDSLVDTEGIFVQAASNPADGGVAIFKSASKIGTISSLGANSSLTFLTNLSGTTSEKMRITSAGNLGIGTSNPSGQVEILAPASLNSNILKVRSQNNTNFSSSVLLVDCDRTTTNNTYNLAAFTNAGTAKCVITDGGDLRNTNNSYGALSDKRLKENITDATPKLDDLMKVKVRNFNMIGDDSKQIGVVAQELEEIFPSMIDNAKNSDSEDETIYKSVKYSVFVPMLIKSIQELSAKLEALECQCEKK